MKTCSGCKEELSSEMFSKASSSADGLQNYCKQCAANKRKQRYEAKKIEERAANRKWYQENKPWLSEDRKKYMREWKRDNSDRVNIWIALRRSKIRANGGSISLEDWLALCSQLGNVCLACGKEELTIDHIVPIALGGIHTIDNVQPLCISCNASKGTKIIDYRGCDGCCFEREQNDSWLP